MDSVLYKMEVTPLAEKLEGEAWIGAYSGNWDAKGHRLSLKLKYYPDEEHRVYNTLPLFNTVNYLCLLYTSIPPSVDTFECLEEVL